MAYKIQGAFNVPMKLLIPTWKTIKKIKKKEYPDPESLGEEYLFFGSFRTFGGTDTTINGIYTIENTAQIDTWFRPDIKSDCMIMLVNNGAVYEILGEPENIEMRNQFLKLKVRGIKGKS